MTKEDYMKKRVVFAVATCAFAAVAGLVTTTPAFAATAPDGAHVVGNGWAPLAKQWPKGTTQDWYTRQQAITRAMSDATRKCSSGKAYSKGSNSQSTWWENGGYRATVAAICGDWQD
jgi:hypothetical protein